MSQDPKPMHDVLDRRSMLSAALAGLASGAALATSPAHAGEHDHHKAQDEHAGHAAHGAPAKYQALVDVALKCVARGEVCVSHCLGLLSTGDTSLKDCMRSVQLMMPMCAALARAGALDAARLKDIAKVCLDVCEDCEKECKKHADHHAACKACMESCADCAAECKKVI